jgi:hypothetical protein
MNTHKRTAVAALVTFALAGGVLLAQSPVPDENPTARLLTAEAKLEAATAAEDLIGEVKAKAALSDYFAEAPANPAMVRAITLRSLSEGNADRLLLLQVQQNQRIISLLEQVVKKK